jgi:hypothetical protein
MLIDKYIKNVLLFLKNTVDICSLICYDNPVRNGNIYYVTINDDEMRLSLVYINEYRASGEVT